MRIIELFVESGPTDIGRLSHEDCSNASNKPWPMDPIPTAFEYAKDQHIIAVETVKAELKVTRKYDDDWAAKHIASFLIAANSQLVVYSRGSPLGLIRIVVAAVALN